MSLKILAAVALGLSTAAVLAPSPAVAYDPCQRAYQEQQEAEADFRHWVAAHCPSNGQCSGNSQRVIYLYNRVQDARARTSRACN